MLNLRRRESVASELSVCGHSVPVVPFPQGTMCLLNFALDPAAGESCCKDQVIFYIRRSSFDRLADDLGAGRISDLSLTAGAASDDGLMTHLGACLRPAVEQPDQINDLIVDQIAGAVHTHLAQRFGAMKHPPKPGKGGLAPWQLRLAQKTLSEHAESHAILDRVASECRLSISHFIRAFTRSAGMPPHRWLTRCRIERATGLLRASTLTLSEIALACGFFDQSHFSRVFSQSVGMAPGQWRKLHPPSAAAARVKEKKALLF